ncbi:MAG: hypothetical protein Sapg2KO_36240 [Saprospiraceae bacterium]
MREKAKVIIINLLVFAGAWLLLETSAWLVYRRLPVQYQSGKRLVEAFLGKGQREEVRSIDAHPYLLYANHPGHVDSVLQNNSLGYRNPEFSLKKDSNTLRILALGGSTTYGFLNRDPKQTWPAILENKLDAALDQPVEVINAGLNYATSAELLASYTFRHRYLEADWVLYHGGGNDAAPVVFPNYHPEYTHFRAGGKALTLRPLERILLRSYVFRIFYSLWLSPIETVYQSQPYSFSELDPTEVHKAVQDSANFEGFRRNLDLLTQLIQMDSSQMAMIEFLTASPKKVGQRRKDLKPILPDFLAAIEKNRQIMRQISSAQKIPYIKMPEEAFTDRMFWDYCHLKPIGEEIKADLIFQALVPLLENNH